MWHAPPEAVYDGSKERNTIREEERQVQLALERSLKPPVYQCQFCHKEVDSKDDPSHHLLECKGMYPENEIVEGGQGEENNPLRRSRRKRRITERYADYSQTLNENSDDRGDEKEWEEVDGELRGGKKDPPCFDDLANNSLVLKKLFDDGAIHSGT